MKYILSAVIGGIILLHTVIAHEHSPKTNQVAEISAHECSSVLFDGVKYTFGIDHGDGHLEQFVKIELETPTPSLLDTVKIDTAHKISYHFKVNEKVYLLVPNPTNLRRGPPSFFG